MKLMEAGWLFLILHAGQQYDIPWFYSPLITRCPLRYP